MHTWPSKDPNENLDYQFDWSARLEDGEVISTSQVLLASGDVVLGVSSIVGESVVVWISGGTVDGSPSVVTNRIETNRGRIYDESARLRITEH